MGAYQTIQAPIEAVRYGTVEGGEWYQGAVYDLAAFILQVPVSTLQNDGQLMAAIRPTGCWDPPSEASLEWLDRKSFWRPLRLGDWLIRFPDGPMTMMRHEDFVDNYEKRPN